MDLPIIFAIGADLHAASTTGILPPGWKLEEGEATTSNEVSWLQWIEGWNKVSDLRTQLAVKKQQPKVIMIGNGDQIDGDHHRTAQIHTRILEEQARMASSAWDEALRIVDFKTGRDAMYFVRGTECHVGYGEESIARDMTDPKTGKHLVTPHTPPNDNLRDGRFVHDTLKVWANGKLFFFAHQIFSIGRREWTKTDGLRHLLKSYYFQHLNEDTYCPDVIVSSHFHQFGFDEYHGRNKSVRGYVTPSLQTKTHHSNRVAPMAKSDIGILIIVAYPNGQIEHHKPFDSYDETKEYKE